MTNSVDGMVGEWNDLAYQDLAVWQQWLHIYSNNRNKERENRIHDDTLLEHFSSAIILAVVLKEKSVLVVGI